MDLDDFHGNVCGLFNVDSRDYWWKWGDSAEFSVDYCFKWNEGSCVCLYMYVCMYVYVFPLISCMLYKNKSKL
jgi:hypothetical protein